ncbi:hypothetical protein ACA910_004681 [Epithemia clementina (nom. ined.)]
MMKITTSKNKDTNITTSSSKVNPGVGTTMTENQSGARLWPLRRVRGTLSQPPSKSLQQQQQQEPQQETNTSSRNEKSPFRIRFRRQPASSKSDLTTSLGASSRQQEEVERKKEKRPTPSSTSCPQTPKAQQVVPKIPKVLTRETANEDGNSRAKAQSGSSGPNHTCFPISQEKVATVRSKTATNEASLVASSLSSLSVASARDPDWSPPLDTHSGLVVDDHPLGIMGDENEEEAKEVDQLGLDGDTKNNKNTNNNNTSHSSSVSLMEPHSATSHSSTASAKTRAGKRDIIKSSACSVTTAAESVSTKSWCSSPSVVGHHYIMALQQQQRQQQPQQQEDIEVDEENEEDAAMDAAATKELLSRMWRDLKEITKNEPQLEQLLQPPRPITTSHEDLSAHKDTRHCTNKTKTKKKKQHSTCFIQSPASWSSVASTAETLSMTSSSSSSSNYHSEFAVTSSNEERSNASSGLKLNKSRDSIAVDAVVHMDRQASEVNDEDDEEEQQTEDPDWSHCALSSHGSFQTKSDNMSVLTLSSVVERAFPPFCSASASGYPSHSNVLSNHSPAWADQQQPPHPPNLESEPKYHHNDVDGKENASQKSDSRTTDQTTTKAILKTSSCSVVSETSAKSRCSKTTRLSYHSKRSKSTGAVSHTTSSHSSSVSSFVVDSEEDAFSDYKEHPLLPIYRTLAKHLTKFYGGGVHDKKDDDVVSTSSASGGGTALSAFGLYFGADVIAPPVVNKTDGRMNE